MVVLKNEDIQVEFIFLILLDFKRDNYENIFYKVGYLYIFSLINNFIF